MPKYAELFRSVKRDPSQETPIVSQPEEQLRNLTQRYILLFVDDEVNVLNALKRIFLEENYEIMTALSGNEAISIMEHTPANLVISDYRMPEMSGAELLKNIKERWPDTIRIMLTGNADIQAIMGAVNDGAVYKFITKPWNDEDLRLTVSLALQQYALILENRMLKEVAKQQQQKIKNYSNLFDEYRGILGSILIKQGKITKEQFQQAQREQKRDEFIGETLVRMGLITESKIVQSIQQGQGIDVIDLKEFHINPNVARLLPYELCLKNRLIPIRLEGRNLTIAMADPTDVVKNDNLAILTNFTVIPVVAKCSDIVEQLQRHFQLAQDEGKVLTFEDALESDPMEEIDVVIEEDSEINVQELLNSSGVPPIIRIVNAVILEAIRYQASDIHIEPKTKYTIVRYRIDGLLHTKIKVPSMLHSAVISRIKILAKIDISERRRPQDGRITIKTGTRIVDVRVSTMPTINGEKVVMRVLDKNASIKKLSDMGLLNRDLEKLELLIKKPQGIIISTGPTGSGKTTMLYSILYQMLKSTKNFETIEDPVEYFLEDANQVYIKDGIGLSFPSVLRATLRQDPDVILVGEIRDHETADVAFKAALTGHMVLTSLHTNNTVASITRLIDMGVKPFLIASAVEGIIAQRLVRKICEHCKEKTTPNMETLKLLRVPEDSLSATFSGRGCQRCNNTGFSGRQGIFEIFAMNEDFRQLISTNYRESEIMNLARAGGMNTLIEDGIEKVKIGITTPEELLRVVGPPTKYERQCEKCLKMIDIKFLFCPYCGTFKQNICHECRIPLDDDWAVCPFCGKNRQC